MIDIPITGTPLNSYIAPWIIQYLFAIDAADKLPVGIRQIPGSATFDTVVTAIEQVDFIAVEERTAVVANIHTAASNAHLATVTEVLAVLGTPFGFAPQDLIQAAGMTVADLCG